MKKQRTSIYPSIEELNRLKQINEERIKKEKEDEIIRLKRFKNLCGRIIC